MFSSTKTFLCLICTLLFISCTVKNNLLNRIEEIKRIGDIHPDSALLLLQDLKSQVDETDVHSIYTLNLLSIRLQDKAFVKPVSDKEIKKLLEYFENNGSWKEKQEVNYYAGSVYRDLNDTPRALLYFAKSTEVAELCTTIDSVMLRNSYSQLYALYFSVQDYSNALIMAKREKTVAKELDILDVNTVLHEGAALLRLDSLSAAKESILEAFEYIDDDRGSVDIYSLSSLLYQLSSLGCLEESHKCYEHLRYIQEKEELPPSTYLALGKYFSENGNFDSAISCYDSVMQISNELDFQYDASRQLSLIYDRRNNIEKANQYAQIFISVSDSLNLEKRQTEAATTHNRYKYQKDKEEEQKLKDDKDRYFMTLLISSFLFIVLVLFLVSFFTYKKNLRLKEIIEKTDEIKQIKRENLSLQSEIHMQEERLSIAKEKIQNNEKELYQMKFDLDKSEIELQMARNKLEERLLQSKSILQLLHQTKFEGNAEGIIDKIRKAAEGKYVMKELDWKQFQNAVNELYPELADKLVRQSKKKISDKQFLFCQLVRVGITNPQIQALLDMPKSTVWRWANKYSWLLDEDYSSEQNA